MGAHMPGLEEMGENSKELLRGDSLGILSKDYHQVLKILLHLFQSGLHLLLHGVCPKREGLHDLVKQVIRVLGVLFSGLKLLFQEGRAFGQLNRVNFQCGKGN